MNADAARPAVQPLFLRIVHWINALAVILMILSGWRIYNASPLFGFEFPSGFTLGGWLAGALAWHFAAMWLLGINLLVYLLYGFLTGHYRRRFLPIWPGLVWRDLREAMAGRATHVPGQYNAVQRVLYLFAIGSIAIAILSGVAIWKPVQMQALTTLMGGFETARRVHFFAMTALVLFIVAHVAMALSAKGTIEAMVTGGREEA